MLSLVVWWAVLVCVWTAFVGTTTKIEVLFGLGAAAAGALAAEVVRSSGLLSFRVDRSVVIEARRAPAAIVFDFALLTREVVRAILGRRRIEGSFVDVPFRAGSGPVGRWRRAWVTTVGTMEPNAIVVELDPGRDVAVLHAIRPDAWTADSPV